MRPAVVVVVLVSAIFVFLQSKTLNQYKDQYSDISVVQALDQSSVVLSSYSFSQVFGVADNATTNNVTATINTASSDKPPPRETWLLDPNSLYFGDANVIPRTINKIYFQKKSGLPSIDSMSANLTAAHKSWEIMNPGYDIRYFDLDQARKYLHQHFHPVFLRAFDCLPAFASKSDLFRMILLYREGGWHSDWKQICLQKYILQNISEVTDIYAVYDMFTSEDFFHHKCVQNGFVGSKPRHPIIAELLEMILVNVQTVHYSKTALDATSTCVFGRAVHKSEEERQSKWFSQVAGNYVKDPIYEGAFQWGGKPVVKHKCDDCGGMGQDWGDAGNNYLLLYKHRNFYCQDAASLFRTTESWL